jgi:hypothetical protein
MTQELDSVILLQDVHQHGLEKSNMGAVVMVHEEGNTFEVEFAPLAGDTLGVQMLTADQIRPHTACDGGEENMANLKSEDGFNNGF